MAIIVFFMAMIVFFMAMIVFFMAKINLLREIKFKKSRTAAVNNGFMQWRRLGFFGKVFARTFCIKIHVFLSLFSVYL
ncbi:hypothetical protein [Flavobacterium cauense]|uniref:hypothetical protein n=1 Tax=Flavobacterium cauense TaxID=510946 RepID=UPI00103D28CF|nr:hypothetical protein [Flavobacterium cauense]